MLSGTFPVIMTLTDINPNPLSVNYIFNIIVEMTPPPPPVDNTTNNDNSTGSNSTSNSTFSGVSTNIGND